MSRVSVIIPVRNGAATIRRTIASALAQKPDPPEIIVVDDGSNDSTPSILGSYNGSIKVLRQRNRGPSVARNAGVAAASGDSEYLAFLDADDIWSPSMLATLVEQLECTEQAVLAYCNVISVDDNGKEVPVQLIDEYSSHAPTMEDLLTRWWPILTSAAVMRRAAFERAGGFDEKFTRPGFEDPFMWLVMREQGDFIYLPERLVRYRTTPPQVRMIKYAKGYRIFSELVRRRYGEAGERLIRESTHAFVSAWGYAGLVALREGDKRRARQAFSCALHYGPLQFRSVSRWLRTFLPMPAVRALSGPIVRGTRIKPELENYFR